jgi:hypothetical protein
VKRALILVSVFVLAATAQAIEPTAPRVTRASLADLERASDRKFRATMDDDPFALLGYTRGVYLEGVGVVFSTEVELAPSAAPNPFRGTQYTAKDIQSLREKKKFRVTQLKESMLDLLYTFATKLTSLPGGEVVAIAVTIPYFKWENAEGMPRQIIMAAPRKIALDAKAGDRAAAAAVKVQELL